MRRGTKWTILIGAGVLVLALGAVVLWFLDLAHTPLAVGHEATVTVPAGAGAAEAAELLAAAGVTEHPRLFRLYLWLSGDDSRLQAGTYRFDAPSCFADAAAVLVAGRVLTRRFTIPEGLTLARIADRLEEEGLCSAADFTAAADRLAGERYGVDSAEGYLFPDTYEVPVDATAEELAELMLEQGDTVWTEESARAGSPVTDRHTVLTLASIVQAEGAREEEFGRIAGVFANRLSVGMRLESCATVLYALGEHKQVLEYRDLKVESPYNTYLHEGLPPGPIAAPGRAALAAALTPEAHDYLYFVSNGDGTHTFSRTLAEHNRARALTREARQAALDPDVP